MTYFGIVIVSDVPGAGAGAPNNPPVAGAGVEPNNPPPVAGADVEPNNPPVAGAEVEPNRPVEAGAGAERWKRWKYVNKKFLTRVRVREMMHMSQHSYR